MEEAIKQLIRILINKELPLTITSGVVKEVSGDVCTVKREGLPDLIKVRLNAIQKDINSYLKVTPKVGSVVLCGLIENKTEEAVVLKCAELEKVEIVFGDSKTVVDAGGLSINLGASGKIDVKNSQEDLKKIISDLIAQIELLTVTNAAGPSSPPNNLTAFTAIKARLNLLFN